MIKKGLASLKKKSHYFNITVTLPNNLKEILLSTSKMVFQKVSNKSSKVGKNQNEERELSNFKEGLRSNHLIRHFSLLLPYPFSKNIFVYSNIFQKQLSISIIYSSSLNLEAHMI